jgi:UDP-N-acetylglucosamine transferase subunit ALG13
LIFVLLGTHEQPFERALDLAIPLGQHDPLLIQHGHTPSRPSANGVEWARFMDYTNVVEQMSAASAVVCHAGVGTIITALRLHKTPVVIPRLREANEHIDDHQLQITREFAARGYIVACLDGDLPTAIDAARSTVREPLVGGSRLRRAVVAAAAAA